MAKMKKLCIYVTGFSQQWVDIAAKVLSTSNNSFHFLTPSDQIFLTPFF